MSNFVSSPLVVPVISTSMKGIQSLLAETSYHVGAVGSDSPSSIHIEFQLTHLDKSVQIDFPNVSDDMAAKKLVMNTLKIEEALVKLTASSETDFAVIAQSLVASLELQVGDLFAFDKPTYGSLFAEALDQLKQTRLVYRNERESKPCPIYVAPFENDFLFVVLRTLKAIADGRSATILCSSLRLMVPLFAFTKQVLSTGVSGLISFIPINKPDCHHLSGSSIQMVMRPADLDCATRAIIKATTYHVGTISWRPSVVLIEQDYEKDFHDKVKKLISGSSGHGDILNENSHLHNGCAVPSYLKSDLEELVKGASAEGAEVIRPSNDCGPVFIFGLAPAAAVVEKFQFLPLGPYTIVLPFRTVNEGLKLAKYFSDREKRILGAGEYVYSAPKSAIIWTDSASLSLQILAKLTGYTTIGVNCDTYRLASSFYLSECAAPRPCVKFQGLRVPQGICEVSSPITLDMKKLTSSTEGLLQALSMIPFDRRLSAFTDWKGLTPLCPTLTHLRNDCNSVLNASHSHQTLDQQLTTAFLSKRLCLLKKWQEAVGCAAVILKSGDLLPNLQYIVFSSICLGSPVLLLVPNTTVLSAEVKQFCDTLNTHVTSYFPSLGKLGPMVQMKQVDAGVEDISAALSTIPTNGVCCISAPEDATEVADVSIEELCRIYSVFWSIGGDLFAN